MKKIILPALLILSLLLCACTESAQTVSNDTSKAVSAVESVALQESNFDESSLADSSLTESELFELHAQRVLAMLDECRPEEAYQFPDFSGEITDVRVTVREREVDMQLWSDATNDKVYDVFYGYLSDGVWYEFPSGNYELRDLWSVETRDLYQNVIEPKDSWECCTRTHVVEIGPYVLCAFAVAGENGTDLVSTVIINDTLNSPVQEITEYDNFSSESIESPTNWHYKENMHAYGTDNYDIYMEPFSQWYFIVLEKGQLTEDYSIVITQEYSNPSRNVQDTYTYDEIFRALGR